MKVFVNLVMVYFIVAMLVGIFMNDYTVWLHSVVNTVRRQKGLRINYIPKTYIKVILLWPKYLYYRYLCTKLKVMMSMGVDLENKENIQ